MEGAEEELAGCVGRCRARYEGRDEVEACKDGTRMRALQAGKSVKWGGEKQVIIRGGDVPAQFTRRPSSRPKCLAKFSYEPYRSDAALDRTVIQLAAGSVSLAGARSASAVEHTWS